MPICSESVSNVLCLTSMCGTRNQQSLPQQQNSDFPDISSLFDPLEYTEVCMQNLIMFMITEYYNNILLQTVQELINMAVCVRIYGGLRSLVISLSLLQILKMLASSAWCFAIRNRVAI